MRRFIYIILASLFLLSGCGKSEQVEQTNSPIEEIAVVSPTVIPEMTAAQCPYENLTFTGRDVNAQHYPRSYSTEDKELIGGVWSILNSPDRIEVSNYDSYEDVMQLHFESQNKLERVNLFPNDNCEFIDTGKKYCLAPGSYSAISALLTDYTTENCSFVIDENFLSIDTASQETLVFMFNAPPATAVLPIVTGDFTEDWVLAPTEIQNGEHTGRFAYIQGIYTNEGYGPVEVSVYFDEMLIFVTCDGVTKIFSTDQNTLDSIDLLLESIENS